jgi:Aspartyl protease
VDYLATNASIILGEDDADSSVSDNIHAVAAIIEPIDAPALAVPVSTDDMVASISVPHLFWRASASVLNNFPVKFDCLLDDGSHLVLIHKSLANSLSLPQRKLHVPIETELAMCEGDRKVVVRLYDYVKLRLYDSTGEYSAKTVHAIVAPNIVAPVILGLPFLAHNSIVVDHSARTAIDKTQNFDLLHPTVCLPPPPPKKRLHQVFNDIKDNRKLMLAELKMVCAERKAMCSHTFEAVKQVDIVAAVWVCIETLAAQEQLSKLSDAVKTKYSKVFNPIPHIAELPMDIYCCIKLKDATKTITTRTYTSP